MKPARLLAACSIAGRLILPGVLAGALGACAVGPDFVAPAAPSDTGYTAQPLPAAAVGGPGPTGTAQYWVPAQTVEPDWWKAFASPRLDALLAAALADSPDLQSADAALRAAGELAAAQRGAFAPSASLEFLPTRQRVASTLSSPTASGANLYTLHTAQLSVAYAPDVFGGQRRQSESAQAQVDTARLQRAAARLTLASNLVNAVINQAALEEQLAADRAIVQAAQACLDAMRAARRAGQAGAADVAAQEALLAQAQAALPALERQLAQQRDLVAALAGRTPATDRLPRPSLDDLQLPARLPLTLPARLVEQRPDIQAAQAQMRAASAQIGIAQAARLPNIALSAAIGSAALTPGTLFQSGGGFWSIGADLVQPLFQGGALRHRQRAAEASYEEAAAQYRLVVLGAFQNVADVLYAIDADARGLQAALAAQQATQRALAIAQAQWRAGQLGHPAVWQAEQAWQQARVALIQARASRLSDTVALFQALGGGAVAAP
ncbi:efflux transporter outer membrane subunit [Massilia phyllosphaerae]|uniref:efflux transporter outer membrane subunit n=1 Tax=Massilia phyllosphaerae TaxID=3106034 RepID=UPI002B1CDE24|nr:efflux transporter outer membrane subunit [Massilia sp. SGZ-792]